MAAIGAHIAEDSPGAAQRWLAQVKKRVRDLREVPFIGRTVPEYQRPHIREVFHGVYRIIYRVTADQILVLIVLEGHRVLNRAPESLE